MTTSVFFANMMWVLLLVNWVAEWNWREKFADFKHNYLLHAVLVMLAVHILWLIGTENLSYAFFDIQKKLPLFALPLVILTSPRLNKKELMGVGACYLATILVMTIVGWVRYLTMPDLPYRQIVPHIWHIRFGLNVCLALAVITLAAWRKRQPWCTLVCSLLACWLLAFLVLLHAYTAFVILAVTSLVIVTGYGSRFQKRNRIVITSLIIATLMIGIGATAYYCYDYFHLKPLSTQPLPQQTANGNQYTHLDDRLIENGNYVNRYICEEEMRREWAKISHYPYDSVNAAGYTIHPTLLRYLNGLGTTKDSLGMTMLTADDVAAIERGIANPVHLQHGLRRMAYMMCFEYENYQLYRSVNDFTMLQRFELWHNGLQVFRAHPWLGVGTGDVVDQCHQHMHETHSPLDGTDLHTHNQYLNFLIAFGLVGMILIAFSFIRAIWKSKAYKSALFVTLMCIVLISFVSEDTLETLAGILFVAFPMSLLGYNRENKNNQSSTF